MLNNSYIENYIESDIVDSETSIDGEHSINMVNDNTENSENVVETSKDNSEYQPEIEIVNGIESANI